jgi:hypothetical protein
MAEMAVVDWPASVRWLLCDFAVRLLGALSRYLVATLYK